MGYLYKAKHINPNVSYSLVVKYTHRLHPSLTTVLLLPMQAMDLSMYREGQHVVDFVAYLVARGVGKGMTAKHISTAKKALEFLDAREQWEHTGHLLLCLAR